jgi:hypothetical protein
VSTRVDGDSQRLQLGGEASPEGFGGGAQPALLHNLTALCVDEAQLGIFVAEIEPGCHLRLHFATIHGGPILLPGRKSPYIAFAGLKVLR